MKENSMPRFLIVFDYCILFILVIGGGGLYNVEVFNTG